MITGGKEDISMRTLPVVQAKHIVLRSKTNRWFAAQYTMNIYRGCAHGCIYCDSRSACYGIEDFSCVQIKQDALRVIRDDLERKRDRGIVATGSMSDPYTTLDAETKLTRHALELLDAYGFGVVISTKSALVQRDIDLLCSIRGHSPVLVNMTITTCDEKLAKMLEPHAPRVAQRFETLRRLREAGIPCCILLMPVLPWITDDWDQIAKIVHMAQECGVCCIYPFFGVTLRDRQRDYFYACLQKNADLRGYKEQYEKRYGNMYIARAPYSRQLGMQFRALCERKGIIYDMKNIVRYYQCGYTHEQIRLWQ